MTEQLANEIKTGERVVCNCDECGKRLAVKKTAYDKQIAEDGEYWCADCIADANMPQDYRQHNYAIAKFGKVFVGRLQATRS
jgi:DNA-directed RNA polymerase subunit RPC12/RpoP